MSTVFLTGANRGIGLELARLLAARGDHVIAAVRQSSTELRALDVETIEGVDLTADDLSALYEALEGQPLDLVIQNAGLLYTDGFDPLDLAAIRQQFEVNTLGSLKLAATVRPLLAAGSKLAFITSRMASIADNSSGGYYGYRMSKVALNMAAVSLAIDWQPAGIAVGLFHPGFVRTRMTNNQGHISPAESAQGLLARIDALTLETSGGFWHVDGQELPW